MANLVSNKTSQEIKHVIQAAKDRGEIPGGSRNRPSSTYAFFELVTDLGDNLWTTKEKSYNTTTNAWVDITNGRELTSTVPLYVEGGGSAGDIVRSFPSRDTDGDPLWIAIRGGGASTVYVEITATTNISTYTATIFDNPVDRTSIETGVTVRALQHTAGTIPNTVAGQGFMAVLLGDTYFLNNYSVFYGT